MSSYEKEGGEMSVYEKEEGRSPVYAMLSPISKGGRDLIKEGSPPLNEPLLTCIYLCQT